MSSHLVENSRIRAGRTEDKLEWPLAPTIAPWKIADGTKIFAKSGPVAQYLYGTGYDTSEWRDDWQNGLVISHESGLIVTDRDADGFKELMARCGIPLSALRPHRPGRRDPVLLRPAAPAPRRLAGAADPVRPRRADPSRGLQVHGFVPVPGSIHSNGRKYQLGPGSARGRSGGVRADARKHRRELARSRPPP